ncbi:MAG: aldehyde dehydrogenase family protein [Bradyrhizobium sp.]
MDMFIDGCWREAASGARMEVINPHDGSLVATVPLGDASDADAAVRSAERAFRVWRATPVAERARLQKAAAAAMRLRAEELGRLLTSELGRPLPAAVTEIQRSADLLDAYAEEGARIHAEIPLAGVAGEKTLITREPVGVVVAITPFNYPITLLTFKLGAALVAGCTVVAKPAENTPLSTLRLAELFRDVGYPPGCFNVVTGEGRGIGMALVEHPIPRKIAFTGGTIAGKAIAASAVTSLKRITLELGGQCPAIVCADADLDAAAAAIVRHAFANSGQFCYRVNRIFVERPAYPALLNRLVHHAKGLTVGDPLAAGIALGPLASEKIYRNSERQIADAVGKGARVALGGERPRGGCFEQGWFLPPTIISDADPTMLVMREETFGPVVGLAAFDDREEALRLANDTRYGLAGFVFCRDLAVALTMAERLEVGSVWVNNIQRSHNNAPFGGIKDSGIGREKGRYGVESYLEYKTIYLS